MMGAKRLRLFAGPNGSGKSTITAIVKNAGIDLGKYINADELKISINEAQLFDFSPYIKNLDKEKFWAQFSQSALYEPKMLATVSDGCLSFVEGIEYVPSWFKRYVTDKL